MYKIYYKDWKGVWTFHKGFHFVQQAYIEAARFKFIHTLSDEKVLISVPEAA